jgi:hypothetical protein
MRGYREYEWDWELDDDAETPVHVEAMVTGSDWAGDLLNPPEYREVEVSVYTRFCPSEPDKCAGCEREDVTDSCSEDFLERMREKALEMEDDARADAQAREEDRQIDLHRERMAERHNPNNLMED